MIIIKLKYSLSVIAPIAGLGMIIGSIVFGIYNYKKLSYLGWALVACLILTGFFIIKISSSIRKETRQKMQTDEYGNKTRGYKDMSKQERQYIDLMTTAQDEQLLSEAEFRTMIKPGAREPEKDLEELIGLVEVKKKISELEAQMEFTNKSERKAFHMCFLGNPGTGKTTVGRILAGFLFRYKFINKNQFIYTDASSIMASPDPSRKIKLILQRAHGSLLFIDEAYCFCNDRSGYEALALLLNEMENSRNNLTVIFAGYKKEMKELFSLNSGLQSRINTYLFFEDYDQFEMEKILLGIIKKKNMSITPEAQKKMIEILIWQKCLPSFANGRTVRKLFENTLSKHYYNIKAGILSKDMETTIALPDISENNKEDNYFMN